MRQDRDTWHLQFLGRILTARQCIEAAYDASTLGVRKDFAIQTLIPRLAQENQEDTDDWYTQQKAENARRRQCIVDAMPIEDMDGLRGG